MKSKLLASLIALCGLTSFAVNPVVVWNGDFDETKSGASLTTNGNTVAGDGSNITISSSATGGVLFNLNPVLTTGKTTIIVKYSGLSTPSSDAVLLSAAVNGQVKDLVGVAIKSNGSYSNIWDNNADSRGSVDGDVTVPASGVIAFTYDGNNGTASNKGGAFYVKNDSSMSRKSQSLGSLYSSGNPINGFAVGGKRSSGSLGCVPNLVIEGVAIFDSVLSANDMAAYTFPEPAPKVEPLILVNFRNGDTSKGVQTSAVEGWTDEIRHGEAAIPVGGTLSVNGISFATSGGGGRLWSNNWATPTADYASGTYKDVFGDVHESLIEEIKTSLCSPDLVLDSNVYKTGFLNGGGNGQSATISGLTVGQKYLVYVGFGLKKGDSDGADQTHTFKIESSGYSTADSLQYVKVGASDDATSYSDYTVGNVLTASVNGLMVVRLNGITPNSSGNIAFTMPSGRSGFNFLAVAKINETEDPGEEEEMVTTDYPATGFLTNAYQDTGWQVTLDEILKYGSFTGTMDGGWVTGNNVPAQGFHKKTGTDGSVAVVEFQMQIYQDGGANNQYLKGTRVFAKEENGTIWLRAVASGNISLGALGTEITSWNGTLAQNATANGYGVASVALSITRPADKKPQGSIGVVTTAHSEDYSSNTITAAVSIENVGEYKGAAVLVYTLGDTQYSGEINADGSASITVEDLEREKVYRGTLALGQKIDETVTVIEGTEQPVALYQGEQKFVWIADKLKIQDAKLVNEAQGLTISNPFEYPDYIDLCDSEYTVSVSASEAVEADSDEQLKGDEQGGIRIAQTTNGLELQVIDNGAWVKFADAAVNTTYTLTVKFHYEKSQEGETDATSVTYTLLDSTTKTATNTTGKLKVTEIFVSDGTNLPNDMLGVCQLDSAVVVDVQVELEPGHPEHALDAAKTKEEAEALAAKIGIKVGETVAEKLNAAQQEAYKGYFRVIAKKVGDHFQAEVVFTEETEESLKSEIEKAVSAINTGSAEIAAKPGLYYGVKRGDSLDAMNTVETEMATSEKVTITITKPDNAKQHFYRIIVSPTPASNK